MLFLVAELGAPNFNLIVQRRVAVFWAVALLDECKHDVKVISSSECKRRKVSLHILHNKTMGIVVIDIVCRICQT